MSALDLPSFDMFYQEVCPCQQKPKPDINHLKAVRPPVDGTWGICLDSEEFPLINKRLTDEPPNCLLKERPHNKYSGNVLIKKP